MQWALAWVEGSGGGESYVNLIPTMGGGTHEAGLRDVVFNSVRTFAEQHGLMQRNVKLAAEDVWSKPALSWHYRWLIQASQARLRKNYLHARRLN